MADKGSRSNGYLKPEELLSDEPTDARFTELEQWIIWQFPRQKQGWLCGAVHPPTADFGWLPAAIYPSRAQLRIHAHAASPFPTPEAAADWVASEG